jgi:guanylate kinase
MSGTLFIISAPSGSGKSTLVNEIRKIVPHLDFSVSYTTRPPRGSEIEGREYRFVDRATFEAMERRGEFLEYADVFGNHYGTPVHALRDARARDHDLLLDIDVQGAAQVKAKVPEAVTIFVLPPSRAELEARLRRRSRTEGEVSDEVIARRLQGAAREIENFGKYDYILVNDRLERSVDALEAILRSERARRSGQPLSPELQRLAEEAAQCLQARCQEKLRSILASFNLPAIPRPG